MYYTSSKVSAFYGTWKLNIVFTRPSTVVFRVGQKVSLLFIYSILFLFVFPPPHQ